MNKERGLRLHPGKRSSDSRFQRYFQTLLDTLGEKEFIGVLVVDVEANGIIMVH